MQPLLPPALTAADCAALLAKCSLLREPEGKGRQQEARQALLLASTCAVSSTFVAALQEKVEGEARAAAHQALKERKSSGAGGLGSWLAGRRELWAAAAPGAGSRALTPAACPPRRRINHRASSSGSSSGQQQRRRRQEEGRRRLGRR